MTQPRPKWLQQAIASNARKATLKLCPCGAPVLAGLDDDVCAMAAVVDPVPLSWAGELACNVTESRPTFELSAKELHRRYPWRQRTPCDEPVLPEHRCNDPVPATWTTPPNPNRRQEIPDEPPF